MKDTKKHGHPGNTFHAIAHPGFSTSFYLSGEEQATLTAYLERRGKPTDKAALSAQARLWFHEMMAEKQSLINPQNS